MVISSRIAVVRWQFCKKGVLKNFVQFTEKHLCQSLILIKLIKKNNLAQMFSCKFCEIFNDTHMENLIQYKNSLKHKVGGFCRFSYVYTMN